MRARLQVWLFLLATLWTAGVAAQQYPTKPVRIVVPYAAGGLPDTMARLVAQRLTESYGQPFIVDNRPGAGGIGACELVAKALADGYTLLVADTPQTAVNLALYAKLPYDTLRDFAPVSIIGTSTQFLAAHASLPASSLNELIALARAKPGQLRFGSSGIGSLQHLGLEALKSGLGLDIVHVPYKGTAQAVPAMLSGEVSLVFLPLFPSIPAARKSRPGKAARSQHAQALALRARRSDGSRSDRAARFRLSAADRHIGPRAHAASRGNTSCRRHRKRRAAPGGRAALLRARHRPGGQHARSLCRADATDGAARRRSIERSCRPRVGLVKNISPWS